MLIDNQIFLLLNLGIFMRLDSPIIWNFIRSLLSKDDDEHTLVDSNGSGNNFLKVFLWKSGKWLYIDAETKWIEIFLNLYDLKWSS